ncbi:hypothetical protein Misp01_00530 [Microtetraspora sp. NBRC 13810]|uniref:MFS transporter n=1 Tax=Microtetraspora sp. NBRC 13810 TaxID=3030990 RepID=UPI0024A3B941|nr:MFS transporter [Microtetraspora sp. NBRC 13810]GLW04923.1 hypothetical protein Misp01_00530 [Microtetraspora sp. NBRC 13810]
MTVLNVPPLRRQRDFRLLWSARAVSETGMEVSRLALPLTAVALLGGSALEMGVLTAASALPYLLVGLPAGALADRLPRRRPVLVACEAVSALAMATVPLAWLAGLLTIPWLIAVAFVVGLCAVMFRACWLPHLPSVVTAEHQRGPAVAGFQAIYSAANAGGPALAGTLAGLFGAPLAILATAATFTASALSLHSLQTPEPTYSPLNPPTDRHPPSPNPPTDRHPPTPKPSTDRTFPSQTPSTNQRPSPPAPTTDGDSRPLKPSTDPTLPKQAPTPNRRPSPPAPTPDPTLPSQTPTPNRRLPSPEPFTGPLLPTQTPTPNRAFPSQTPSTERGLTFSEPSTDPSLPSQAPTANRAFPSPEPTTDLTLPSQAPTPNWGFLSPEPSADRTPPGPVPTTDRSSLPDAGSPGVCPSSPAPGSPTDRRSRPADGAATRRPSRGPGTNLVGEMGEGIRMAFTHPILRPLVTAAMTVNFVGAAHMALFILFAVQVLGIPAGLVGLLTAAGGIGGVAGAAASPRLARRLGEHRLLLTAIVLIPVDLAAVAAANGPLGFVMPLLAVSGAVTGIALGMASVCYSTIQLRETPPALLGRVNATMTVATHGIMALGGITGGLLGELLGLRPALWICAALAALAIPLTWLSPLRP